MRFLYKYLILLLTVSPLLLPSCKSDNEESEETVTTLNDEWYSGGKAGTVFNATSRAYRQPMPFVNDDNKLYSMFMRGEKLFGQTFVSDTNIGYSGLGPVYIRNSCLSCHPGYGGRGRRVDKYDSDDSQCGYLLMIYNPTLPGKPLATKYFTGMTQTRAVYPFTAPIQEDGIHITWNQFVDEHGNRYEDGTPYSEGTSYEGTLIYPTITIDQDKILFPDFDMSQYAASIEATIGIYGVGLLDAISDEDLRAEYEAQQARGYAQGKLGSDAGEIDETGYNQYYPGLHPGRFTYLCTRATLDNGPGSNAIWNITNVTRPDRRKNYITEEYAKVMSSNSMVQSALKKSQEEIYADLLSTNIESELSQDDYNAFMVWHRTLAVPAARNLDDEDVKHGKSLFNKAGCVACHRPSWTTRDNYLPMPQMSNQKIFPYTDLLRHDLGMIEPGRVDLCRTTPLWGRGLMYLNAGHTDMLHDLRARNYEEAILWHNGQAKTAKENFRTMSKSDRSALIKFLKSI
ncbi:MAG: thiol oxidoreductase [Sphingobacteriia bacterium]|nr:thiol oxidoreductase [Sphingobacteriia bacterium]